MCIISVVVCCSVFLELSGIVFEYQVGDSAKERKLKYKVGLSLAA